MTKTESPSRTDFLNRLLGDEGSWLDLTTLLREIALVYGLDGVGVRWPAEGPAILEEGTQPRTTNGWQYPLTMANRPAGLFWINGAKKNATDEWKLLANALSVAPVWLRLLRPYTEQDSLAQRLDDAAKVAGRVAHDLDNVFQGVMGFTLLAKERLPASSPVAELLQEVQVSTDSGMQFCQQLHQLSRAGQAKPFPGSLAHALAAEAKRLATNEQGVPVEWAVPPGFPAVAMDEGGLRQLFGHLLNNAVEATTQGQPVAVTARLTELHADDVPHWLGRPAPGACAEITVQDRGIGMDASILRRIFVEPFVMTKFRHRGLSLSVVYRMLYAHRGGVRVVSNVGQGTTITVVLPLATAMFHHTENRTTGGSS